ncbi:MAG: PHB depolymerase family esterase [Deltaproteobacteria bacterium]|nr:PHB depolymerase family esterase [Deltaproteobacteria bacterium]
MSGHDQQMDEREYFLRKGLETALFYLTEMELSQEHISPESFSFIRDRFDREHSEAIEGRLRDLGRAGPLPGAEDLHAVTVEVLKLLEASCEAFCGSPGRPNPGLILESFRCANEALNHLYPLRKRLPGVAYFFIAPEKHPQRLALDPDLSDGQEGVTRGVIHEEAAAARGARTLYVPEYYDSSREWPLIVALHGGSGSGRHFVWTWLREAKSRGYLLAAPSSIGGTWSPDDDAGVTGLVAEMASRYKVDRRRVLLTGMSDGATFSFIFGLAHPEVFTALVPLCGVLHPAVLTQGYLEHGKNLPIYLAHGVKDWLFPIDTARMAAKVLEERKIDHVWRELPDLSHAYPRSENDRILDWLESK